MEKEFNITGVCSPDKHYMADINKKLASTLQLVRKEKYFIINRPRQYGKTTMLNTMKSALLSTNDYVVFNISFEGVGDVFFKEEINFTSGFWDLLQDQAAILYSDLVPFFEQKVSEISDMKSLSKVITALTLQSEKHVVLMIDEVDKSSNNQLFINFLGMLRDKFLTRDETPTFQSVVLAGLHDIKTLKSRIRPEEEQKYNSPWNIASDYNVDLSFQVNEIIPMLEDYSSDRGVKMDFQNIAEQLFYFTSGYPFLVSKLCKMLDEDYEKHDVWTKEDIEIAVRKLVRESNANFDSLTKNIENNPDLYELVYDVAIDNNPFPFNIHNPTIKLGYLYGIFVDNKGVKIHNRIYNQVLTEYMTVKLLQQNLSRPNNNVPTYKNLNGTLNMELVMLGFQVFMKKEYSRKDRDFLERNGRLVFLAFLKPIINL